eukprot:406045_1
MACLFGSDENRDKINRLEGEITSLKKELIELKEENRQLKSEIDSSNNNDTSYDQNEELKKQYDNEISSLNLQISTLKASKSDISQDTYTDTIEELKAENKTLKASQKLLQKKDKEQKEEILKLKQQLGKINTSNMKSIDEIKEKEQPMIKSKPKKYNLNKLEDQIEIICSEGRKARSYLLCQRSEIVHNKDNNQSRHFGFMDFLETSLNDKVVGQLFSKFKSNKVDAKNLVSLLTLTVIIYQVKLHKMKSGSTTKPPLDSAKIKSSVEHLAVWVVRTFGENTNNKKNVSVTDDDGKTINGEFNVYNANFPKETFSRDVKIWVTKYVDSEGMLDEIRNLN